MVTIHNCLSTHTSIRLSYELGNRVGVHDTWSLKYYCDHVITYNHGARLYVGCFNRDYVVMNLEREYGFHSR